MTVLTHDQIKTGAQLKIDALQAMRRARPLPRLWTTKLDGDPGLLLMGAARDNVSGDFPFKNNGFGSSGTLRIRMDHYLAKWVISLEFNPAMMKQVIITVDHMGGAVRWSGLLKYYKAVKAKGVWYLDLVFIDDLQYLQFLLGPPNPGLPIPVFQWPRVLPLGPVPAKWGISMMILLNLIRVEGNLWTLPDDPFDIGGWGAAFDWSQWQVLIKALPIDLDDSTDWVLLATRMNRMDQVISDALEDAQLTMTYRRIITVDGETSDVPGVPTVANGALVLKVVDNSGVRVPEGTATGGALAIGFAHTIQTVATGLVEDVQTVTGLPTTWPPEYYDPAYLGPGDPRRPWINARDSKYSSIETSEWTWGAESAVSAIVGGDNPLADQLAQLLIESLGAALGYFFAGGFSGAGAIAADVIMPLLVGCIAAWLQWKHSGRVGRLGWVHLWEVFGQGAENNAWGFGAAIALRSAFISTKSESAHVFSMGLGGRFLPGIMFGPGTRMGSTFEKATSYMRVDQVEEMTLFWDYSADRAHDYKTQVGKAKAAMTQGERNTRAVSKALTTLQNLGVHLIS